MSLLETHSIVKTYPGVRALDEVNFTLQAGQIHALIGVNGAGKTTLVKIIAGAEQPDSGEIYLDERLIDIQNVSDAADFGIVVVHQERTLIRHLNVAENIMLGQEPSRMGALKKQALYQKAETLLEKLGVTDLPLKADIESLGAGKQQLVDIVRALRTSPKVLVLDEPTAALSATETQHLFQMLCRFKEQGVGIIFVSHHLDEVFEIADYITILRDGRVVSQGPITNYTPEQVPQLIVGREIASIESDFVDAEDQPVLLEVRDFTGEGFRDISLEVHAGEVVALAGVIGAGRTELLESLVGYREYDTGSILLRGQACNINTPHQAIQHNLILVPDKRMEKSLMMRLDVLENLTIASLSRFSPGGWLQYDKIHQAATKTVERLNIVTPSLRTSIGNLSGGNKQKVVFGKWLTAIEDVEGKVFLFDEPTEGIDVGARAEMWRILRNLAAQGAGVVVASSDLEELMTLADRIYVMRNGKMVHSGHRKTYTHDIVLQHMLGAGEASANNVQKESAHG